MPVEPLDAFGFHVETDHQLQVQNIFVQGLHKTEQIFQVCGQSQVHSSLHHVGAHVPVEHGHGAAGVIFKYQTLFLFLFSFFGLLIPEKNLLNLFRVKMDMLIFQSYSISGAKPLF